MSITNKLSQACFNAFNAVTVLAVLFCIIFMPNEPAHAQSAVCVKNVNNNLALNGVVASGTAKVGCALGPVWQTVAPVEFLPAASSPSGYLFVAYRPTTKRLFIGIDLKGDEDLSDQDVVYLLFDATNNDIFDEGDFYIKVKVSNSMSPIISGELCNQSTGAVEYYRFVTGTGWESVNTAGVASAITTKASLDYDNVPADMEDNIWNLELDMPVGLIVNGTTYFGIQTTGNFFGIGCYVFVDDGHQQAPQQGFVLKWPSSMVDRTITQQNIGGIPSSQANELGDANLNDVCFDVNFTAANPWEINSVVAGEYDYRLVRNSDNTFRVSFYSDGPGTNPAPLTNNGTVELRLRPYGNISASSSYDWIKTVSTDFNGYNQLRSAIFFYDFSKIPGSTGGPPTNWSNFSNIDFVCATMELKNFDHDDNLQNNSKNINYNYFQTSTYTHDFLVFGENLPNLKPGESTTIFLRMQSANELPEGKTGGMGGFLSQPSRWTWQSDFGRILWVSLVGVSLLVFLLLLKWRRTLRTKNYASALAVLVAIILCYQAACACFPKRPQRTERWQIKNADVLGIKTVKGKRDWYEMPIKYGEIKRVELEFSGKPLPYETVKQVLKPAGSDGNPNILRIPVKPGEVITALAFGQIDLDGPDGPIAPTSPTGFVQERATVLDTAVAQPRYLLREGYYSPNEYAGALIGSFDNFENSFVASRSNSVVVPDGANTLNLAVNAVRGSYAAITGAYEIFTTTTPSPSVPTHTMIQGDATYHIPPMLNIWEVLTSLNVYTYYQTIDMGEGGVIRGRTMHPWGSAHYSIYDTHEIIDHF